MSKSDLIPAGVKSAQAMEQFIDQAPDSPPVADEVAAVPALGLGRRKRRRGVDREPKEKISLNMLVDRVAMIDRLAARQGLDRSAYINLAVFEKLQKDGAL